jgi:hypothetical protein
VDKLEALGAEMGIDQHHLERHLPQYLMKAISSRAGKDSKKRLVDAVPKSISSFHLSSIYMVEVIAHGARHVQDWRRQLRHWQDNVGGNPVRFQEALDACKDITSFVCKILDVTAAAGGPLAMYIALCEALHVPELWSQRKTKEFRDYRDLFRYVSLNIWQVHL